MGHVPASFSTMTRSLRTVTRTTLNVMLVTNPLTRVAIKRCIWNKDNPVKCRS